MTDARKFSQALIRIDRIKRALQEVAEGYEDLVVILPNEFTPQVVAPVSEQTKKAVAQLMVAEKWLSDSLERLTQ